MITDFIIGVEAKHPDSNAEFRTVAQSAVDTIRTSHASFSLAGAYLVDGFVNGISANTYKAAAQAKAMASAAVVAAKKSWMNILRQKYFMELAILQVKVL